ncbi:MAG: serine hydrolase [Candidatus Pacebacteria bacterium]|nr:serine hydrolase [Candidatus Paceibacterota bacterium]
MRPSINKFLAVILLLGGFCLGYFFVKNNLFGSYCDYSKFRFVGNGFRCGFEYSIKKSSYASLKLKLSQYIDDHRKNGDVSSVSVYFRDLENGPTLGIEEHEKFSPASLLKLPVLLAYLNFEEDKPGTLKTELVYQDLQRRDKLEQNISVKDPIKEGVRYTIEDLLRHMIKYSDNKAYYVLLEYLHQLSPENDLLKDVYVDLGIVDPKSLIDETISVKSYSSIFAQIYYSSFFETREISELALSFLVDVDYRDGLVAGVPSGIPVAHKFGERTGFQGGVKQLHDCGIVYFDKNPYLLCVMTRGQDFSRLAETISEISRIVYRELESRRI